eukprot:CAMPEP_0201111158 /NCGR_PEP_ID=MMETSP0812-20130820/73675_1 /ASSEMBLY_ACC=CAM_ASM_000668 /TAXON_ID=98059 /ORGANISM="Dinobryon sp., Strain UTEXLB2267" /LENGTH=89 /DNA_ID=CAMNT_0047373993 /DNA_START=321 /DNA_END=587 /DNA_ORIENTATION=+
MASEGSNGEATSTDRGVTLLAVGLRDDDLAEETVDVADDSEPSRTLEMPNNPLDSLLEPLDVFVAALAADSFLPAAAAVSHALAPSPFL